MTDVAFPAAFKAFSGAVVYHKYCLFKNHVLVEVHFI